MSNRKKTWAERAKEILAEVMLERLGPEERLQQRLRWEDWASLRGEAAAFAAREIRRRKWRGSRGGVLPGGLEASDIAGLAIADLLEGKGRLSVGFTRERVVRELERLIRQKVRQLHKLAEAPRTRSEWDVALAGAGGEGKSIFETIADERSSGERERRDLEEVRERLGKEIEASLSDDAEMQGVFRCMWAGVASPGEIATRLGMSEAAVKRAQKRLKRKVPLWVRVGTRRLRGGGGEAN